ncbi:MAG TPA: tetratricopeptide repeat protein, partial [Blastocatellia bacterium]|nr:tetratricopeptide repeat protein [Blastocatellia bacterium]
ATVSAQTLAGSYDSSARASAKIVRDALARGEDLRRRWKLEAAEAAFREAATLDPSNLDAALGLARISRARFDYSGALRLLERAAPKYSASPELLAEYGSIYLNAEDPARARVYFDKAIRLDPASPAATVGRAGVDLLLRDYKSAEERLREQIALNPGSARACSMLARVLLEGNRNQEAEEYAERALALDPYDTDALHALAFVKATERKPDEVRSLAGRALGMDKTNAWVRRLLSQYLDGQIGYRQKISESARLRYERGKELKDSGRLAEAVSELETALSIDPRYYLALIALGDIWLREGDYERAATAAKLALEVDPEGALAHLQLSYAHWGRQERARIQIGATDFSALFYRQPAPPAFALTAEIFPNYKSLTRRQQIVIDRAVAPLARFLPKLAQSGARHYLLMFDERVSEVRGLGDVAAEKTFDGRNYASIRGVGGLVTVSGIEYIETTARGGFHTIAHEFAHQVHMTALDKEDVKLVRALYDKAVREGRALDYYAATNEFEYFAQGYEAFISNQKRPSAGVTARHTDRELAARDPELHNLLLRITGYWRSKRAR